MDRKLDSFENMEATHKQMMTLISQFAKSMKECNVEDEIGFAVCLHFVMEYVHALEDEEFEKFIDELRGIKSLYPIIRGEKNES